MICGFCSGEGIVHLQRDNAIEKLGCPDCEGTGLVMCSDGHACCSDFDTHSHFLTPEKCLTCKVLTR